MENYQKIALELETIIRSKKGYWQDVHGTDISADAIEAGAFIEVLQFYLADLSGGRYSLTAYCPDVGEDMSKSMQEIGYKKCLAYMEQFKALLNV